MRKNTGKRITIIQGHPDPNEAHLFGLVEQRKPAYRARWIDALRKLGSGAK